MSGVDARGAQPSRSLVPSASKVGPADDRATYHRLVAIKYRLPGWLRRRLDPYNTEADRFVAAAAANLDRGATVLDAGAGECRHAGVFGHTKYFGTDNQLGDTIGYDYARVSFVSDLRQIPVRTGAMDAVVSVNVLEHVAEPVRVLEECRRVLRPGGRLFLVAPQSWRLHQAPQDFLRFTRYGLAHLLEAAGFAAMEVRPLGGAFWNLGLRSIYLLTHFKGRAFPVALLLAPLLGFLVPLLCYYLDHLDRDREDTLGYAVVATKSI
jgi:SAM-dependent methyltransferase